jgi:hypothetical protein
MARRMWGNDAKMVYRSIVTVRYPAGWSVYGHTVSEGEYYDTTFHGPFLAPGPARAAATKVKRDVRTNWQFRAKRNPTLEMPKVEVKFECSPLDWKQVDE